MAFDKLRFLGVSGQAVAAGRPQMFEYITEDSLDDLLSPNYFRDMFAQLFVKDRIRARLLTDDGTLQGDNTVLLEVLDRSTEFVDGAMTGVIAIGLVDKGVMVYTAQAAQLSALVAEQTITLPSATPIAAITMELAGYLPAPTDAMQPSSLSVVVTADGTAVDGSPVVFDGASTYGATRVLTSISGEVTTLGFTGTFTNLEAASATGVLKVMIAVAPAAAASAAPYVLPVANATTLGGVKIGDGVIVTEDGIISVAPYVLPTADADTLGGVKIGTGLSAAADGTLSVD